MNNILDLVQGWRAGNGAYPWLLYFTPSAWRQIWHVRDTAIPGSAL